MRFLYLLIIIYFNGCATKSMEEIKSKETVENKKSGNDNINQKLPLGLKPCKEYLVPDADSFRVAFDKLGVPYQEPTINKDGNKEVKFKYRVFNVRITKDKNANLTEYFEYKNKKYYFSYYKDNEFRICDISQILNLSSDSYYSFEYSINKQFHNENVKNGINAYCQGKDTYSIKERIMGKSPIYDFSGKIISGEATLGGCKSFSIWPYLKLGKYFTKFNNVRVRENPDTKSKIITELAKNSELELIEDTGKIEEIGEDVAPWGKVKLKDGKEGYVYGALLKEEGFFWD